MENSIPPAFDKNRDYTDSNSTHCVLKMLFESKGQMDASMKEKLAEAAKDATGNELCLYFQEVHWNFRVAHDAESRTAPVDLVGRLTINATAMLLDQTDWEEVAHKVPSILDGTISFRL